MKTTARGDARKRGAVRAGVGTPHAARGRAAPRSANQTQAYRIRAALEREIVLGRIAPGTKLDEEVLAAR